MAKAENIKVAIRMRKTIAREKDCHIHWKTDSKCNSTIWSLCDQKKFLFDRVFREDDDNAVVYNAIALDVIDSALRGFNSTIFAYGQTSSGKTYTMFGSQSDEGIIRRAVNHIFNYISENGHLTFLLRVSFMEIYNERVIDLLNQEAYDHKRSLLVRENSNGNIIVDGLTEETIVSRDQIFDLMAYGEGKRHYGSTNMNDKSSRSHSIFRIIIESAEEDNVIKVSHLNLVDLAGSERASQTGAVGDRLREGGNINKSLFVLGQVIAKLSEGTSEFIPFRDSNLTRILKNSLGGNTKTAMICTVTPVDLIQTKSTLEFASRAKTIVQTAHVNEVMDDRALMKKMQTKIEELTNDKERADQIINDLRAQMLHLENAKSPLQVNPACRSDEKKGFNRRETWCAPQNRLAMRKSILTGLFHFDPENDTEQSDDISKDASEEVEEDLDIDVPFHVAKFVSSRRKTAKKVGFHFESADFSGSPSDSLPARPDESTILLNERLVALKATCDAEQNNRMIAELQIKTLSSQLEEVMSEMETSKEMLSKAQSEVCFYQSERDKALSEKTDLENQLRMSELQVRSSLEDAAEIKRQLMLLGSELNERHAAESEQSAHYWRSQSPAEEARAGQDASCQTLEVEERVNTHQQLQVEQLTQAGERLQQKVDDLSKDVRGLETQNEHLRQTLREKDAAMAEAEATRQQLQAEWRSARAESELERSELTQAMEGLKQRIQHQEHTFRLAKKEQEIKIEDLTTDVALKKEQIRKLEAENETLNAKAEESLNQARALQAQLEQHIEQLSQDRSKQLHQILQQQALISSLESDKVALSADLTAANADMRACLESTRKEFEQQILHLREYVARLQSQVKDGEGVKQSLLQIQDECELAGREAADMKARIADLEHLCGQQEQMMEQLRKETKSKAGMVEQSQGRVWQLEQELAEAQKLLEERTQAMERSARHLKEQMEASAPPIAATSEASHDSASLVAELRRLKVDLANKDLSLKREKNKLIKLESEFSDKLKAMKNEISLSQDQIRKLKEHNRRLLCENSENQCLSKKPPVAAAPQALQPLPLQSFTDIDSNRLSHFNVGTMIMAENAISRCRELEEKLGHFEKMSTLYHQSASKWKTKYYCLMEAASRCGGHCSSHLSLGQNAVP